MKTGQMIKEEFEKVGLKIMMKKTNKHIIGCFQLGMSEGIRKNRKICF